MHCTWTGIFPMFISVVKRRLCARQTGLVASLLSPRRNRELGIANRPFKWLTVGPSFPCFREKLGMKVLSWSIISCCFLVLLPSWAEGKFDRRKERAEVSKAARAAVSELRQVLIQINGESFSSEPSTEVTMIGKLELPPGTSRSAVLRQRIQYLIAQIDLAQDYPSSVFKGDEIFEILLKGNDFFGVPAQDLEEFERKQALLEQLFDDPDLQFGNRLFGLMQGGSDTDFTTLSKWIKFMERLAGPEYLGVPIERQATSLGSSLKALTILRGVTRSSKFRSSGDSHASLQFQLDEALNRTLKSAVIKFARMRFEKGGLLRDWSLPVASAAERLYPDLNRSSIGVTSLAEYEKAALRHARALTSLVKRIDENSPSPKAANESLRAIRHYLKQPFYIGSTEVRESGTLKVEPHQEIETLLEHADFFGPNGNQSIKTYQGRSQHLEAIFFGEGSEDNLALLISLKPRDEWLRFFDDRLFGGEKRTERGVFPFVDKHHRMTNDQLKVLFLARAILPSQPFLDLFARDKKAEAQLNDLLEEFGNQVRDTASLQFRNYPKQWINIQNGFLEVAKGFPDYNFENLKVTTSTDLTLVRRDFDKGLYGSESVAEDILSLMLPKSEHLIDSIDQMTSPELSKRIGKYDKKLSPQFVSQVNEKLSDILKYRSYGLAAIDNLERPDLQAGRIMTHFAVSDYRLPGDHKTNTVMHDLVCGPDGGFGGLGQIFRSDAKGYRERESVLDAVAISKELELGETLFQLALDINRGNDVSDEDLGRAAHRWIQYFRKSQANAQFHTVPDVLNQAVRGTFLTRVVFQSESFQKALENSSSAPVGSPMDISHELEAALSAQIRKMQAMLRKIDPLTATNRNIDETADKWQDFKVWYLESTKWLESVISDPVMIGEISRIRKLNRKVADYQELCPEVLVFKKALEHFGGGLYNENNPPTLELARFAMDQVTQLEPDLGLPLPLMEGTPDDLEKIEQLEFGKAVSNQFLNDIRQIVKEAEFEELANVTSNDQIEPLFEKILPAEANRNSAHAETVLNRAKAMEGSFKAAIAKAISRVEAEQPSDFRTMQGQAVRAAKVDRLLSEDELAQYRIDIEPSMVISEWINKDRVEIMADFRTFELSSEARQMINKAKQERQSLVEIQEELRDIKADSLQKQELLQKWIDQSENGENVEGIMEEVMAMREEVAVLNKEISHLRDSETLMRARAADFAQRLFQFKRSVKSSPTPAQPLPLPEPSLDRPVASVSVAAARNSDPQEQETSTFRKPPTTRNRSSGRSSSSKGFFQRIFGRKR